MRVVVWRQICCRQLDRGSFTRVPRVGQQFCHDKHPERSHINRLVRGFPGSVRGFKSQPNYDHLFFEPDTGTIPLSQQQSEEAILRRAGVHGIDSLERLAFEADLESTPTTDQRLAYDRSTRQDLDLWAVLLDYRRSKDGSRGIRAILDAMLYGSEPVILQTDALSEHIWHTVLPVVMEDEKLFYELCHIRSPLILDRPYVFTDIVSWLLVNDNIRLAIIVGTQLLISRFRGRSDLIHLFEVAVQATTQRALNGFCDLVSRLPSHQIYPDTVPKLWAAGRFRDAFEVHRRLLFLGDLPTQFSQLESLVSELAARQLGVEPFIHHLESSGAFFSHQTRQLYTLERARLALQPKTPSEFALSRGPGMRPVKLSDQFVARTFATRSVSFEFILNGLRFIGLFEIGPLAIREIALTSDDISVLKKRFQQLDEMNVDVGASSYVRVIKNLCSSDRQDLLNDILQSDMHYEVFEEVQTQKRLLAEYYQKSNWPGVNRILAILNQGRMDGESKFRSARLLLQTCLILGDWRGALKQLDDLRRLCPSPARPTTLAPLRMALRRVWAAVGTQQRQATDYLDRSRYLTGFMQLAHIAGLQPHLWQWRSIIHAVGRAGSWDLCRSLIVSLARTYRAQPLPNLDRQTEDTEGSLAHLFDGSMQAFIVELGLVSDNDHQGPGQLWLQGVQTLFELALHHNVPVDYEVVVEALKSRLLVLFDDPDPKAQRRFVVAYLRCFNWAWRHCAQHYKKEIHHKLYQRGWQNPDSDSVRLFQLRAKGPQHRREPFTSRNLPAFNWRSFSDLEHGFEGVEAEAHGDLDHETASKSHPRRQTSETDINPAVFYEDLLHPSFARLSDAKR